MSQQQDDYGAGEIQVLEGLEGVRERPAMYIGSTDAKGLHHLVYEVVDNSIDEALANYCDHIDVTINEDGSVSVTDNGRGIPVDTHEEYDRPAVEVIMTVLHAGGKFDSQTYEVSGGLHGVGVSATNALSEWLEVTVWRDGYEWKHRFERGKPVEGAFEQVRELDADEDSGTEITFMPDGDIFSTTDFDANTLEKRMRQLAFLNSGVKITLADERDGYEQTFLYEGGLREYVTYLTEAREALHDEPIYLSDQEDDIAVEIALQATEDVQNDILSFANNINTHEGGKHLTGFKTALTRVVNDYGTENNHFSDLDETPTGDDIREGLSAVISIKHPDPQFEGQTKTKLVNANARSAVESTVNDGISTFFEENPDVAEVICERAVEAAKARKAAEKAQQVTRRKNALSRTSLPGKLADCQTRDPSESELFIVEGDSAGGSSKQGRDRECQAILPLRGKIINVEKHRLDRVLENNEIQSLITAIGTGIGDEFNLDDARYEKIIIQCDADVDGAHIRTLLLTFFFRHMRPLLEAGYVYAAKPPLYRIKDGGDTYDVMTEAERERVVEEECGGSPTQVQRFKGLGEMNPGQLWETTMDPENRRLKQITVSDAAAADKKFSVLMGDAVDPRKQFIKNHADDAEWVDI